MTGDFECLVKARVVELGIMHILRRIALFRKLYYLEAELKKTEHLDAFAAFALDACKRWFGHPADAEIDCHIVPWHRTMLVPAGGLNYAYLLLLSLSAYENLNYLDLGHEIYHRVTCKRRGLRELMPVDEMLADLASRQLLREYGIENYVQMLEQHVLFRQQTPIDVTTLFDADYVCAPNVFSTTPLVTEATADSILRTGKALVSIVGWHHICRLIQYSTLEEWIQSLGDVELQNLTADILGFPYQISTTDLRTDPTWWIKRVRTFSLALFWIGRREQAIQQLMIARSDNQLDFRGYQLLADLLFLCDEIEDAESIYDTLLTTDPTNAAIRTDFAMHLLLNNQPRRAIHQLAQASPDSSARPEAQYHLGVANWRARQYLRADECWNRVRNAGNPILMEGIRTCEEGGTPPIFPFFSSL